MVTLAEDAAGSMKTILIVDDSPTLRRMVRASLQQVGVEFIEASTGLEAIQALGLGQIDAWVLDLNMPDMHGLDVLKFLREQSRYRRTPVLVLTTRGDATTRDTALQAGASAYMTKPFAPTALAQTMQQLLNAIDVEPS